MAANIQDRSESTTAEIATILRESRLRWLTHDESLKLFNNRHLFPLSLTHPGPTPRRPGLFFFDDDKFSDHYAWDDVGQPNRKNCASDSFPDGAFVKFTVATRSLKGGGVFSRRTHHARKVHDTLALVQYRFLTEVSEDSASSEWSSETSGSPSSSSHSSDPEYVPEESLTLAKSRPLHMKTRSKVRINRHDEYPEAIKHFGPKLLEHFNLQIEKDNSNPKVYTNRCVCHLKLGNLRQALMDAETALQLCPTFGEALHRRKQILKEIDHA